MIHQLENDQLRISVNDLGAELISIYDKTNDRELLWQADPAFWKRHAPILFPNVGKHYKNSYTIGSKAYPSSQHGFARDSEFICSSKDTVSITHTLTDSEETLKIYPFKFELNVTHTLQDKTLTISWSVKNLTEDTMYFAIGGHPAFRVPLVDGTSYNDYSLSFENQEALSYCLINTTYGTAIPETIYSLPLTDGSCKLDTHMFDHDALIFDNYQIRKVSICMPDGSPYLEMDASGFPNFGIWSVPGADFVCLEPWMGRCDDTGFSASLDQKENINILEKDGIFTKSYTIKIF